MKIFYQFLTLKKYPSEQYEKLTDSQKEYYDFIIALKQKIRCSSTFRTKKSFFSSSSNAKFL